MFPLQNNYQRKQRNCPQIINEPETNLLCLEAAGDVWDKCICARMYACVSTEDSPGIMKREGYRGVWVENRQTDTFLMEMLFFNEQRFKGCAANEMSAVSRIKNSHRLVWENLRGWFDCDAIREC